MGIEVKLKKLLRTAQSEVAFLKEPKDRIYFQSRRLLRRPHEKDFWALAGIPDILPGCYVDVGGNQGQSIESIKLVKPNASIISFEANAELATKLAKRYANRADVQVRPYGLGDEDTDAILYTPVYKNFVYDGLASCIRDHATTWISPSAVYGFDQKKLELRESLCQIRRLDDQCLTPIFIKVNVQGFGLSVFNGGIRTVQQFEPVLMVESLSDDPQLAKLLKDNGYEEYRFENGAFHRGAAKDAFKSLLMTSGRLNLIKSAAAPT
jgi:FkbM family methyltransferase